MKPRPTSRSTAAATVPLSSTTAASLLNEVLTTFDKTGDAEITVDDFKGSTPTGLSLPSRSSRAASRGHLNHPPIVLMGPEEIGRFAALAANKVRAGKGDEWFTREELSQSRTTAMVNEVNENWTRLSRQTNSIHSLAQALEGKHRPGPWRVYAPEADPALLQRLTREAEELAHSGGPRIEVRPFPRHPDSDTWKMLNETTAMAYLPRPFVVPGGMFNEMFNWDSVFIGQGLLASGGKENVGRARDILENFAFAIENYGKIPNSNFGYLLSRTQPPMMPRLALAVDDELHDVKFLKRLAEAGLKELETVWKAEPRVTASGLSRYHDNGEGHPVEVEAKLYDYFPEEPAFQEHQRAIRESGHDDTHQFGLDAQHHEPVELNSLLYRYERELAEMFRRVEGKASPTAKRLEAEAEQRKAKMQKFWDAERGQFFDWNFNRGERTGYESLSTFFPLADGWATPEQAAKVAAHVSDFLEKGGLSTSTKASRVAAGGESFQWDYPFGWGPLQQVAVEGLRKYHYDDLANEVAYRWCSMVMRISGEKNGLMKEKYDVVQGSSEVNVEYGNQGESRGPLNRPEANPTGFGWTNSSFLILLQGLPRELRAKLDARPRLT